MMEENSATLTSDLAKWEEKEAWLVTRNKIGDEFYEYQDRLLKMKEEFKTMWKSHLGRVSITKHQI